MNKFSTSSRRKLDTCHPDLIKLFEVVLVWQDVTIAEGERGKAEQDAAYARGASKLKFPESMHNTHPSLATDVYPYPYSPAEWEKDYYAKWYEFCLKVQATADTLNIKVLNGGLAWGWDFPHWQLED